MAYVEPETVVGQDAAAVEGSLALPGAVPPAAPGRRVRLPYFLRLLLANPRSRFGLVLLSAVVFVALAAPLIARNSPTEIVGLPGQSPSWDFPFGTTDQGYDVYSQVVWGSRVSLIVGACAALLSTVIATVLGIVAAYRGGLIDDVINLMTNIFLVIPVLPLLIVVSAFVPSRGPVVMTLILAATTWAVEARILRGQALTLRNRDFVLAAKVAGESMWRIVFGELIPNMISRIAAAFVLVFYLSIIFAAGLEFLGFGDVNKASWGVTLYWAQNNSAVLQGEWWHFFFPGIAIATTVAALIFINFGVDEISNPRLRRPTGWKAGLRSAARRRPAAATASEGVTAGLTPQPGSVEAPLVELRDLVVDYVLPDRRVRAVDNVSLSISPGEIVGLAGESGCGKTTAASAILQILRPPAQITSGQILFQGRDIVGMRREELRRFRWRHVSMVFQSAMDALNPVLRVGDQFVDMIQAHERVRKAEALARAGELLKLVGIDPRLVRAYPHELSGGMRQRVIIAMALALRPQLVLMDEPTTALDVVVQREILQEIQELQRELGFAVLFITHDLSLLVEFSDRIAIMYAGEIVESAPAETLFRHPQHPYTVGLMRSFPPLSGPLERITGIPGLPPDLARPPSGCRFHPRCSHCDGADRRLYARQTSERPRLRVVEQGHLVACHLVEEKGMTNSEDAPLSPGASV